MVRWGWLLGLVVLLAGWQNEAYLHHLWRHLTGQKPGPDALAANVTLYTYDDCGAPCADARGFFRDADIRYAVVNVDHDAAAMAMVQGLGGGLPLIVDGRRQWQGYDPYFLEQWYLKRSETAHTLDELGLYPAGARHTALIFGASWCRYCHLAADYFQAHGIPYRVLDVEADPRAGDQERRLFGDNPLPGIVYADMLYEGYSEDLLNSLRKWNGNE